MEESDGAVESAFTVRGEDFVEEVGELLGDIKVSKAVLLCDLANGVEYDECVANFGCEWDRRSEFDEK